MGVLDVDAEEKQKSGEKPEADLSQSCSKTAVFHVILKLSFNTRFFRGTGD